MAGVQVGGAHIIPGIFDLNKDRGFISLGSEGQGRAGPGIICSLPGCPDHVRAIVVGPSGRIDPDALEDLGVIPFATRAFPEGDDFAAQGVILAVVHRNRLGEDKIEGSAGGKGLGKSSFDPAVKIRNPIILGGKFSEIITIQEVQPVWFQLNHGPTLPLLFRILAPVFAIVALKLIKGRPTAQQVGGQGQARKNQ